MKPDGRFTRDNLRKIDSKFKSHRYERYLKVVEFLNSFARENHAKQAVHLAVRFIVDPPVAASSVKKMAQHTGKPLDKVKRHFTEEDRTSSIIGWWAASDEVAGLIAIVCSPKVSAITGTAQRVDGGIVEACF